MADNTTLNPGTGGDTIATDDIGGVKYQRVKVGFGTDGVFSDVTSAQGLPTSSTDIGAQADAAASSDSGTFSLIALIKRMLSKMPSVGQALMAASQPVAIASDQSNLPIAPQRVTATGSISALNGFVELDLQGMAGAAVDIRGTFVGTCTFQTSVDGTNVVTAIAIPTTTNVNWTAVSTATAVGSWFVPAAGCRKVRITATAFTSGSMTIVINGVVSPNVVYASIQNGIAASLAGGTNAIGDVGVQYRASTTGAAALSSVLSPATPSAGTVKGTAGRLLGWQLHNGSAGVRSVKVFNVAAPTLGTTSAVFEIDIPAGAYVSHQLEGGILFSTAIVWTVTSAKGLADNTATGLAANDVSGAFYYQ